MFSVLGGRLIHRDFDPGLECLNNSECDLEERVLPELDIERPVGLISLFAGRILFGNPFHQIRLDEAGPSSLWRVKSATHGVNCLRENCQSKFLAIGSDSLAICDPQRDVVIRSLHDHNGQVHDVAWHGSQPFVLSSVGDDSTLRMWDVRSHPAQVCMRRLQRPFYRLQYSPDSNLIACGGEHCIMIYDLYSNRNAVQIGCPSPVTNLRFNPAECLLATSHRDHTCRFYDIDTGECVTQSIAAEGQVDRIEFHPQGQYLIVAGSNSTQTITWEPFSVLSQHLYRHHGRNATPASKCVSANFDGATVSVLDMAVLDGKLLQLVVEPRTTSSHQVAPVVKVLSSPLKELEMLVVPMTDRDADACEGAIALSMFGKFKLDCKESESSQTAILSPPLATTPQDNANTAPQYPTPNKKKLNSRRPPPPLPSLPPPGVPTGGKLRRRSSTDALESSGSTSTSTRSSSSSRMGRERDSGNSSGPKNGQASKPARIKPRSQTVVPSIASKCDEVVKSGTRVRETLRKRKEELSALLHSSRLPRCGASAEVIIGAGAVVGESHVLSSLLREYLSFGSRAYTIDLNSQFLEHLRPLFNHPNNSYVQLALDFLVDVVDSCGDTIRHGLLAKDYCIGVDVAAESRYDRCLKCRNGLMQIRLNSSFLAERMDKRQTQVFESALAKIDEIIDM